MTDLSSVFLRGINDLRPIDWARGYTWDIKFDNKSMPTDQQILAPFNVWFPAHNLSVIQAAGKSMTAEWYMSDYKFPLGTHSRELQITFYDDVVGSLNIWITNWFNDVYDTSNGILCLDDAVRKLIVLKLNLDRSLISQTTYTVFPDGVITDENTSNAELKQYTVSFNIIETSIYNSSNNQM